MSAGAPPRTVRDWWRATAMRLRRARLAFGHGTTNARDEAAWLLCHALRIEFDDFSALQGRAVNAVTARRIEVLVRRRIATRAPLAYVLGEAWLAGHRFHVDRRVIVPRSHIAELLPDGLRAWMPRGGPRRILDLCTGSGCLAILAALAYPRARVDASDVSAAALAVARRNVAAYRLGRRVRLVRSDLFAALGRDRYDLILCNPPYVPVSEMRRLPRVPPRAGARARERRGRTRFRAPAAVRGAPPSRAARRARGGSRRRPARGRARVSAAAAHVARDVGGQRAGLRPRRARPASSDRSEEAARAERPRGMGWLVGIEPTTLGITIRCSTPEL